MKNKSFLTVVGVIILVFILSGCGSSSKSDGMDMDMGAMTDPITAELSWSPQTAKVNEKVHIQVIVKQKDTNVDKADEVMFEISKEGDSSQHEKVAATNSGDGKFTLDKTFTSAGTYSITSHVTVGPQHTMPTKKLIVTN
ncbi:FixH family protein [Paenibacillus pini]